MLQSPYGYSGDMTAVSSCVVGSGNLWVSPPIWPGADNVMWVHVWWDATIPDGAEIKVEYRIDGGPWTVATNGAKLDEEGQKFQLRAELLSDEGAPAPTLHSIGVKYFH